MNTANARQVAGTHYRTEYQHWDMVIDLRLGYFEGQVTKYVTRARKKNGQQDLEKAIHFMDKLIEAVNGGAMETPDTRVTVERKRLLERYAKENQLSALEAMVVDFVANWRQPRDLRDARNLLQRLFVALYGDGAEPQPHGYVTQGD